MTDWSYDLDESGFTDRASLPRKIFTRTAPALAAFSFSAVVALQLAGGLAHQAYAPDAQHPQPPARTADASAAQPAPQLEAKVEARAESQAQVLSQTQARAQSQAPAQSEAQAQATNPYGALFDPDGSLVGVPALYARSEPIGPAFSPLQGQPLFAQVDPVGADPAPQVADAATSPQADTSAQQVAEAEPQAAEAPAAMDAAPAAAPSPASDADATAPDADQQARQQIAEADESAPLPPVRPAELAVQPRAVENATPRRRMARASLRNRQPATPLAQNDPRSFFDKLFGGTDEKKGPQLAYASQESGGLNIFSSGRSASPSPYAASHGTAVYDIAAHTVYLPDGRRLEAHSGLGPYLDDPGHVHLRMRGSTPPAIYELRPREALFHGVRALRLTPVSGAVYGRSGLLAHTFMLGGRGDLNGCVSFRDYRAFLEAYQSGEVRRLVVVPHRS